MLYLFDPEPSILKNNKDARDGAEAVYLWIMTKTKASTSVLTLVGTQSTRVGREERAGRISRSGHRWSVSSAPLAAAVQ